MAKTFTAGDKVFAKVRGYPAWPARVEGIADSTPSKTKYHVFFYGTSETAVCKVEDLYHYAENKEKYGKPLKRKGFNEALAQIEGLAPVPQSAPRAEPKHEVEDSDGEGNLVIDESPALAGGAGRPEEGKKKAVKRKRDSDGGAEDGRNGTPVTGSGGSALRKRPYYLPPSKRSKRDSLAAAGGGPAGSAGAADSVDSGGPASPPKPEIVSRSGRKIKPKKFADEEPFDSGLTSPGETGLPAGKVAAGPEAAVGKRRQSAATREAAGDTESESQAGKENSDVAKKKEPSGRLPAPKAASGPDDAPRSRAPEGDRERWESAAVGSAARVKAQLEAGDGATLPEQLSAQAAGQQARGDEERKMARWSKVLDKRKTRLKWLKVEARMVEVDALIKGHLSLRRASPDHCLRLLEEMCGLLLDPLMLKKHPQVVETIKRLRRYIGNVSEWGYSEEEKVKFSSKALQIRNKAEFMYNKFKAMFTVPEGRTFWQVFSDDVSVFQKKTQHLPVDKLFALVVDPTAGRSDSPPASRSQGRSGRRGRSPAAVNPAPAQNRRSASLPADGERTEDLQAKEDESEEEAAEEPGADGDAE